MMHLLMRFFGFFNYYKVNCGIDCYIIIIRPRFNSMQHSSLVVYLTQLSKYGTQLYVDTYSNFKNSYARGC